MYSSKEEKKKTFFFNEEKHYLSNVWGNVQRSNICIVEVSDNGEKKGYSRKNTRENNNQHIQNLVKAINF